MSCEASRSRVDLAMVLLFTLVTPSCGRIGYDLGASDATDPSDASDRPDVEDSVEVPAIPPPNDDCPTAATIVLEVGRAVIVNATTVDATPSPGGCGPGPDVWYTFSLGAWELVHVNTYGSPFDTTLGLGRAGCSSGIGWCSDDACGTQQSEFTMNLPPGTYWIAVGSGATAASGEFKLTIEHLPSGSSGMATMLGSPGTVTATGWTAGASSVTGSCGGALAPEYLSYWTQCPRDPGGLFRATTCLPETAFDTVVYLRDASGVDIACNDNDPTCALPSASTITAAIPPGPGLFGVYVDGAGTSAGGFGLITTLP